MIELAVIDNGNNRRSHTMENGLVYDSERVLREKQNAKKGAPAKGKTTVCHTIHVSRHVFSSKNQIDIFHAVLAATDFHFGYSLNIQFSRILLMHGCAIRLYANP